MVERVVTRSVWLMSFVCKLSFAECPDKPMWAVDVVNRRCQCRRSQPSFGLPGETRKEARWCARCPDKPATAVNVKSPRCECGLRVPTMGLKGAQRNSARWCKLCPGKPEDAVNVASRRCECGRSDPSLGLPWSSHRSAQWCAKCPMKPPNAINVLNKRCECGRCLPSLGLPEQGITKARWCARCPGKLPNAVNVVSKRCLCGRGQPSLGMPGELRKEARWCAKCPDKPDGAVNVVSKRCECGRGQPSLGRPNEPAKMARWCSRCPSKPHDAVKAYKYSKRKPQEAIDHANEANQDEQPPREPPAKRQAASQHSPTTSHPYQDHGPPSDDEGPPDRVPIPRPSRGPVGAANHYFPGVEYDLMHEPHSSLGRTSAEIYRHFTAPTSEEVTRQARSVSQLPSYFNLRPGMMGHVGEPQLSRPTLGRIPPPDTYYDDYDFPQPSHPPPPLRPIFPTDYSASWSSAAEQLHGGASDGILDRYDQYWPPGRLSSSRIYRRS